MPSKKTKNSPKQKSPQSSALLPKTEKLPTTYPILLSKLKADIQASQIRASLSVNQELLLLYWRIGQAILERQKQERWGSKIIEKLSKDLSKSFPDIKGFTTRNLLFMRAFAEAYEEPIVKQLVSLIPWGHNIRILQKIKNPQERIGYVEQTIQHGWSRNILVMQIEKGLHQRTGKALSNFKQTLPPADSDLAHQILKDPYVFDFLSVGEEAQEREVEKELVEHITKFLLELGAGFAFVGQQYHLEVGEDDFYIDLLFYHLKLRCYVVIELKTGKFKPEYAGKLNFYLSAIDDKLRHPNDGATIGLLLCKDKNKLVAEYALKDISKPVGISEYKIVKSIPAKLKTSLPSIEELEKELQD